MTTLDCPEVGCKVVEIAESAGGRKPYFRDIGGNAVEATELRDAEQAEGAGQQEKENEDRRKLGSD